ncbi:MAG: hypothetical protein AABX23_02430 [Nanoarchaeota archaeon]
MAQRTRYSCRWALAPFQPLGLDEWRNSPPSQNPRVENEPERNERVLPVEKIRYETRLMTFKELLMIPFSDTYVDPKYRK